jgi:hypothetical protein
MESTQEIHQELARSTNGEVWKLLEKEPRTAEDEHIMVDSAHASNYHWRRTGSVVNLQRGEWLLARVYTVLSHNQEALWHAKACLALTEENPGKMQDFDLAYGYEAIARAQALAGAADLAAENKSKARELGEKIAEEESRQWFQADFNSGEWYGID